MALALIVGKWKLRSTSGRHEGTSMERSIFGQTKRKRRTRGKRARTMEGVEIVHRLME